VDAPDDLLIRLASALAAAPPSEALSERLCLAARDLAGADGASVSVSYDEDNRVTLCASDKTSQRLEDLEDVMQEGPGLSAWESGSPQGCRLGSEDAHRWPNYVAAARRVVSRAFVQAVPMRVDERVIGVLTFYQSRSLPRGLALPEATLVRLGAATGAALVRDPTALDVVLDDGPWDSRAKIHQATGMVMAQLRITSVDAIAVLRAHAYAGDLTLEDVARRVLERSLKFRP
jgi:ANTAR domain-containing protein/GAF domain-containing protein